MTRMCQKDLKVGIYSCLEKRRKGNGGKYNRMTNLHKFFIRRIGGHADWNIKQVKYAQILKDINTGMVDHIVKHPGTYIDLPCNMGELSIRTKVRKMFNAFGKISAHIPIDRMATFELWNNDSVAKAEKRIIHILDPNFHIFSWNKNRCIVKNRGHYHFIMVGKVTEKLYRYILEMNRDIMYPLFGKKSEENMKYNKCCGRLETNFNN